MTDQTTKKQVAVRLELRRKAQLEREASDLGVSRSEYIRDILGDRHRADQLADQLEQKKQRIQTLEEQLERRHDLKNEIQELPDKIRGEPSYSERRQRKLDQASLGQRLKWKVTGVPVDPDE